MPGGRLVLMIHIYNPAVQAPAISKGPQRPAKALYDCRLQFPRGPGGAGRAGGASYMIHGMIHVVLKNSRGRLRGL